MIITLEPPLLCGQMVGQDVQTLSLCGLTASMGIISPGEGQTWELLPVCEFHFREHKPFEMANDREHLAFASVTLP